MNNIILSFTENGYEYFVYKKGEEYIALKKQDGKVVMQLSLDEKKMINSVFDKLKVKRSIKLPNIIFEGKEYKHFYDKENNFHSFLNVDGSKLTLEEFKRINYYYNNQEGIVYFGKQKNDKPKDTIQRIVRVGKKLFVVTMLSSMLINAKQEIKALADDGKFEVVSEVQKDEIDELVEIKSNEKKLENLRNAVNGNENLTDEEKEFILSGFDVLEENINFIDYATILDNLEKLRIEYRKDPDPEGKAAGFYTQHLHLITIFNAENFKQALKSVLSHEVYHAYQKGYQNPGLYEVCNSMMNEEYSGKTHYFIDRGYDRRFVIALMEIIGNEPFRQYNFTGEVDKIKEPLMRIINDEAKVEKLILDLDSYTYLYSDAEKNILLYDIEKAIGDYYSAKYGKPYYLNPYLLTALHQGSIRGDGINGNSEEASWIIKENSVQKGYFNREAENYLKEPEVYNRVVLHEEVSTTFTVDELREELHIDESYSDQDILRMSIMGVEVVDAERGILKRTTVKGLPVNIPVSEKDLLKISKKIKNQIDNIQADRLRNHNEIVRANRMAMALEEIKNVKDFGVMKINDEEQLVYRDEEGNTVININSEFVSKINEKLKGHECTATYNIIEDLNVLSVYIPKMPGTNESQAYNINLSNGDKFKFKKYLRSQDADEKLLDADAYYLDDDAQLTPDKTIVITKINHTKGENPGKVTQHTVLPKAIKDGQITYKSEYAKEVTEKIKQDFKNGFNYEVVTYEPDPSYGCVSIIVYDDTKVKVYRFEIGSWKENDLNNFFLLQGNEEDKNVFVDEEGNAHTVQMVDGKLETSPANFKKGK